jgi:hypothetical protein
MGAGAAEKRRSLEELRWHLLRFLMTRGEVGKPAQVLEKA